MTELMTDERLAEIEKHLPYQSVGPTGLCDELLQALKAQRLCTNGKQTVIEELDADNQSNFDRAQKAIRERDELQRKYDALVAGIKDVGEVHPSWGPKDDFTRGWSECRYQFLALLEEE